MSMPVFSDNLRSEDHRGRRTIATARSFTGGAHPLLSLQRTAGNQAVARLIECQRAIDADDADTEQEQVDADTEQENDGADTEQDNGAVDTDGTTLAPGEQLTLETADDTDGPTPLVGPTEIPFPGHGPGGQACQISGTLNVPSGVVPANMVDGHTLRGDWFMSADFSSPPGCGPFGEYRQFISGKTTRNGVTMPGLMCRPDGKTISENQFIEDMGCDGNQYGYHRMASTRSTFSKPDQPTGRHWDGDDHPSVTSTGAPPGTEIGMDLLFEGRLVNVDTGATIESKNWQVKGSGRTT
jgi:hypothetical protein